MDGPRWSGRDAAALALVTALAALLFFSRLRAPLLEPQEARCAEAPRQMLAAGEWVVPSLRGGAYLDKPPLLSWAVMASYWAFGVRDRTARLVPAAAGVITVVIVFLWGRAAFGRRAGLLAALVLCLTPAFVYRGRMLTCDAALTPCVAAALAAAHAALRTGTLRRRWWLASAAACGLGLLAKGPVAVVLVAVPVALACWRDRPRGRDAALYLATALAVAAPWYAAMMARQPDFAGYFLWKHNVERFAAPFDHARPAWHYLPGLALGTMPWALLLPGLAWAAWRRQAPAALALPLAAFAWGVLFFSLAGSKRDSYLLPTLPPLALALGWAMHTATASLRQPRRLALAATAVVLAAGVALPLTAAHLGHLAGPLGLSLAAPAGAALLVTAALHRRVGWGACLASTAACAFAAVQFLVPAYHDQFALRGALRRQMAGAAEVPVVCYPRRFESLAFYLPGRPVRAFGAAERGELLAYLRDHPEAVIVTRSGATWRRLVADLPASVEVRGASGGVAVTVGRLGRRRTWARRLDPPRSPPARQFLTLPP